MKNFQLFHFHTGRANSYYPRGLIWRKGNSPNSKIGWDRGVWVPGAVKLDHLQPFKPILFWKFHHFLFSCPRAHFLYSPGNWENGILPTWVRHKGLSARGIQTIVSHSGWENSISPFSAFLPSPGVIRIGLSSIRMQKLENLGNNMGSTGCKWSSLNTPGTEKPVSHSGWENSISSISAFLSLGQ